ncbi:zinc metalloprotease HtpX [Desulfobacter hydrogenophilus]|uniref:Protease HtpX homolog n=1 Tax=Desulfobacter hydrogenophilus TaxID=2291 RepID=A0A328FGE2_9BACT|nr:zinc metalloprotease HtpX [Desulfobacter hydrogenophilus]NDY71203.1 zinc metalloprotease HtpX [Desulfobacter hydrogenophilus]QBH14200.1 zinc metalloprotease HtpX [Desulfobacter hydrogenophilus]RAM02870.1 zinc metalloprotease HtpX [Desulfobacter hydrogenophilus]
MANQFKTGMLLIMMTSLFLVLGYLLGGQTGMFIALIFAGVMNISSYWYSDKIVLKMYRAQPLERSQAPGLFDTVDRLARQAGLPMPKVYLIPESAPNAFATGRNPEHAVVAVTQGLMNMMNQEELEGVLAHELGHVKNRDILISTIVATLAGAIMWIASIARFSAFFGGSDDDDGGLGIIGVLVVSMVAPIAAMIVQMAVSRSREYLADATAASITGNPNGLASALSKLGGFSRSRDHIDASPATAHMFIVNPLTGKQMMNLFSTHPPIEERVARLVGSRPPSGHFSGNSRQENENAHSAGTTMEDQSRSFWDNLS